MLTSAITTYQSTRENAYHARFELQLGSNYRNRSLLINEINYNNLI